jgi:hypothetical protein
MQKCGDGGLQTSMAEGREEMVLKKVKMGHVF